MMATSIFCAHYDPDTGLHLYQLESLNSTALKKKNKKQIQAAVWCRPFKFGLNTLMHKTEGVCL